MNENTAVKKEKLKKEIELKYELDKLRKNCLALFNVTTSVFDGAVCSLNGNYTISEMKTIIENWKKKGAK